MMCRVDVRVSALILSDIRPAGNYLQMHMQIQMQKQMQIKKQIQMQT